jgi:hypothetical protein
MSAPLTPRDRKIAVILAVGGFVFITYFIGSWFMGRKATLDAELASQNNKLKLIKADIADKPLYEQREAWLSEKLPKLTKEDTAGVELLEMVKELAKKHTVQPENPRVLTSMMRKTEYTAVSVDIETKSSWASLVNFLRELQGPDQFIVVDSANFRIDPADKTQMRGRFRISRWYAPK